MEHTAVKPTAVPHKAHAASCGPSSNPNARSREERAQRRQRVGKELIREPKMKMGNARS